ncbi:methionine/alanine import family NSS transporter small subunit [Aeromicrobium choanae]|uniref:Putative methionine and alanine importer, small subunit n=1 Tax=Aeromicrobium choanae TaxID=1736691 RepID=A0A1T4Z626_9ACTN|nr:methionine/alanine import family NSS transporter small subunit [Aeromicrobium choanae]SKB09500.1 Putative methionine and alanine importer, small subunit [Aeromicrobium choanae]
MSAAAITMMIVAMVALWGGLALAIFSLTHHDPEPEDFHRDL